jgi:hypothetical protein
MDENLAVRTAKGKPGVTFVGDATVNIKRQSRLQEGVLNSIEFREFIAAPVDGRRLPPHKRDNLSRHSSPRHQREISRL